MVFRISRMIPNFSDFPNFLRIFSEHREYFRKFRCMNLKARMHEKLIIFTNLHHFFKAGMRSYFNGGGSTSSATPPPSMSGRARSGQILGARSSSASLPRSPESDLQAMMNVGGSSGSAQGSLGSHGSNQEVYVNIYQNTNHPSLFVSVPLILIKKNHARHFKTRSESKQMMIRPPT